MKFSIQRILLAGCMALLVPFVVCGQAKTDSLIQLLNKLPDTVSRTDMLRQISVSAFESGEYSTAIDFLLLEIEESASVKDSVQWANAHYRLGMVYTVMFNYEDARKHSQLALDYFERNGMLSPMANACINLGFINNELKLTDKAFNYYNRALKILTNVQNQQELDASYLNLGVLGRNMSAINKLRENYEQTQSLANRLNSSSLSQVYSALAILSINKNDIVNAEKYAYSGLEIAVKNNDISSIANGQILLGKVYYIKGLKPEAYRLTEKGLASARQTRNRPLEMEAYSELAKISMSLNQPALAYNFLDRYIQIKDSLSDEQLGMQMKRVNRRFEVTDNNMDPAVLLKQNLDQSLNIRNNFKLRIALIIALFVIALLLFFFFRRYYSKSRVADQLKEKNKVIEDQKTHLEELIQTKDRFLSIIAHDLKNPFNSLLGFADLAYNDFDEISDNEKKSYLNVIRQSGQHIYTLLDNLLSWSRAQSGRIDFYPEPVSLTETIENAVELVRSSADNKQIALFSDFSKDVIVKADKNMLSTILRNLLTNAIKFTPNGGSVTVSSRINSKKVTVSVADTGIGMTPEELDRLFKLDGGLKNSGTANETGTGLGLILCQEFMSLHKSKIIAESTPGKGSTFSFTLDFIQQL
ncbi:MAG TPA: tetratricopeptide repeat-containing sensor histidine kinase [Lentimicrobium sp.]|nr:tetratricopeptide repeat-containing sensor histidine kinase [Lentimicrobium sp.]